MQEALKIKILVQVGNLGDSIVNHLISPIASVDSIDEIFIVKRHAINDIPKVRSHSPPNPISKCNFIAIIYEFFAMLYLSIIKKPNVICGYLIFPHGIIAFLIGKLTKHPVIISLIAGPVELYAPGSSPLGVKFDRDLPWFGRLILRILESSDAIITTGSFTKEFLINHNISHDKIYPIICPPNKNRVCFKRMPKLYDVLYVGRLAEVKHVESVIYITEIIKKVRPKIKVCIVGDGPCRTKLLQLSRKLGVKDNIDFVGFQKDVSYYYNSSKVFILTSEREGFPNVFLEAISCGLPSVISNCGDILDIAKDGSNCIIIKNYNDYAEFAVSILRLLDNKDLYQRISQNAITTKDHIFSNQATNKWESVLNKIAI